MSKPNTQQIVSNYHPDAVVVFMQLDAQGLPSQDANHIIVPDIEDVMDINLTLGSTGKTGTFTLKLTNTNDKYFYPDDINTEVDNLNNNEVALFEKQLDPNTPPPPDRDILYEPAKVAWKSAKEFLNHQEYNRIYNPITQKSEETAAAEITANEKNFSYLLYRDSPESTTLKYRKVPNNLETSQEFKDTQQSVNLETVELSETESQKILDKSKTNASFYTDFGGQVEHGRCMFEPMQMCTILMSRRCIDPNDTEDLVTVFTGLVDSVSSSFDGTNNLLIINGSDLTKWMRVSLTNVNPSLFENRLPNSDAYKIWDKKFAGLLGWQIIMLLVVGGIGPEGQLEFGSGYYQVFPQAHSNSSVQRDNANKISKTLIIDGLSRGDTIRADGIPNRIHDLFFTPRQLHIQMLPWDSAPDSFTGDGTLRTYARIWGSSFSNWQNEYMDNLEIAVEVAKLTNFEFYADQYGDIWYHQPRFHNYHILTDQNPDVYVIKDEDIIEHTFTESDEDIVTTVYCTGTPDYVQEKPQIIEFSGFYEDKSLVARYGRRMQVINHPYVATHDDCVYFAKSYMLRRNSSINTGTVTILGRPELRVYKPIYIPMRNMIYSISEISHSFTFGQRFVTTLKLSYGHKPWEVIPELLDYGIMASGSAKPTNHSAAE